MGHFSVEIMRLPGQLSVEINILASLRRDDPAKRDAHDADRLQVEQAMKRMARVRIDRA